MYTPFQLRSFAQKRSLWIAATRMVFLTALLFLLTSSGAAQATQPGENLLGSTLTTSQTTLAPGEILTYTVTLRNSGSAGAVVSTTVVLPSELACVPGSISTGGSLQDNNVVWNGVSVGAGASVPLTFQARPVGQVSENTVVNTVAAIMSEYLHLIRFVQVTLIPPSPPTPAPNLAGSYKSASRSTLAPGEVLTYTIKLINSGTADAMVDVTDPVPPEVNYVSESVTADGHYDGASKTVSWAGVAVPAGGEVPLSFAVTGAVDVATPVTNTATINVMGHGSISRKAWVLLVPRPVSFDIIPPRVHSLTIDEQDVLTSPQVTLHISASDNVAVTQMQLREWQLTTVPFPHWEMVASTGWIPFQADYPWTLGSASGTHFVGVWVADAAHNVSQLDRHALDYASLLLPATRVPQGSIVPYLVYYEAGVNASAILTPIVGTAELFVWYPFSFLAPDRMGKSVTFITPRAGTYLFLVHGTTAATCDLSISPGGGSGTSLAMTTLATTRQAGQAVEVSAATSGDVSNPLIASGLDPLSDPTSPAELPGENLLGSTLTASQSTLAPGEILTFTVTLRNTGSAGAVVSTTVVLPSKLTYVPGSVSGGGSLQDNNIVWNGVPVGAGASVPLTFQATPVGQVTTNTVVNTVAAIMSEYLHLIRFVQVTLVPAGTPPPQPTPNLMGSYKSASQSTLAPDEVLTYTIKLVNSGTADATVDVTDPVPAEMNYVAGSATGGGVYGSSTKVLSWNAMTVPMKSDVSLSFAVTATVESRTCVTNTVIITVAGDGSFQRQAYVVLVPQSPPPTFNLVDSYKSASQSTLAPGEVLTYTIKLINSGTADVTVNVTDPVAAEVNYVSGSATGGGVYNSSTKELSWSTVTVPMNSAVSLSFAVTTAVHVNLPAPVANTATINIAGDGSFQRRVWVLLVPRPLVPPVPRPSLIGSFKFASRVTLAPGETLIYTIWLHNSGIADAVVNVTDPVPSQVSYVLNSATGGGAYDSNTRLLSWTGVTVPMKSDVSLSFAVTTTERVNWPTWVINTATISVTGNGSFRRSAPVLLLPTPVSSDNIPPVVHGLTIDEQDVLTGPTVTLHISATDNIAVTRMYVREWQLATTPLPHWEIVRSSGWVPYEADYSWTLGNTSGTHFVGVWIADAALNISHLNGRAIDFASLLRPGETIPRGGLRPYLVHLGSGVSVSAILTPTIGDADLYVWYPGSFGLPDQKSTQSGTTTDAVSFVTPRAGTYMFLVYGYLASTYDLSITPGGGEQPGIVTQVNQATSDKPDELTYEPVLSQSGLDPLGTSDAPQPFAIYLPLVKR